MSTDIELRIHPNYYLPDWVVHPTVLDPVNGNMVRYKGAEQGRGERGEVRRRHPWAGVLLQRDLFERSEIKVRCARCEAPKPPISNNNDKHSNNDGKSRYDNLNDGTEDANHNGRIDGDNGDGKWTEGETWTETSPNLIDSDGDSFSDKDERDWHYNPLSIDTDGDGLTDDDEDKDGDGFQDSTETSVINSDTDGDGLSDKMELDGWTVIIIFEATLKVDEERNVTSNPLISDYDEDGINDCGEFENGTDPNDSDTDGDGFSDKEEIDFDYGSSPTGVDGQPPTITDFDASYEMNTEISGPWYDVKIVVEYSVVIKVSANDIFGVRWLKVHLSGVGEDIDYCSDASEFNNREFEFTLDMGQATRSLFDGFEVNGLGAKLSLV